MAGAAAAIAGLLADIPTALIPPPWNLVVKVVVAILGGLAVVTPEKGSK